MFNPLRTLLIGVALQTPLLMAHAGPAETPKPAASQASSVAVRVEGAVKRGATAAASATEHGLNTAAHAAERGVKTAASAVERGTSAAGRAIENTARKLGLPAASSSPSQ